MKSVFILFFLSISLLISAQAPTQISYQGVARNSSGTIIANQQIAIKFDIHQGSAAGTVVFTEQHTGAAGVSTNAFGLFTTYIGSINNLGVVNWANGPFFIEVSIDPANGTAYNSLGSQQLMSVPFALYAQTAGNSSSNPTITINSPNTISNPSTGVYSITVPSSTLSINNNSLTISNGNTVILPSATSYSAGNGIDITGGVISNTYVPVTPTISGAGSTTVSGTYPNLTISSPSVQAYTAGNGIDITNGVISNTTTVSLLGINAATVTGSYPNFTVNVPNSTMLPNAFNGQLLFHNGVIWDTIPRQKLFFDGNNVGIGTTTPQTNFHVVGGGRFDSHVSTPQIYTDNIKITGGTNGQVLTSDANGNGTWQTTNLNYNSSTNELALLQGTTTVATATLNGTGSNTVSITGAGMANVTPTTGSTFTVSVPNPTLSVGSGSISISNGNSVAIPVQTLSVGGGSIAISGGNAVAIPSSSTTLVQGNNISLNQSGNTYTVSAPAYSISLPGGNVAQITNGISTSTAAINATNLTLSGSNNNILSAGGNTVGLNTYTVGSNLTMSGGSNYTISAASYSLTSNSNTLTLSNGSAVTTVTVPQQTLPLLTYTNTAVGGVLQSGPITNTVSIPNYTLSNTSNTITLDNGSVNSTAIIPVPTLTISGSTLQSGPSTNTVSLAGIGGIYGGSGSIPTGSTTVSIGTNTLNFVAANNLKPIANFVGNGTIQPSLLGVANATTGASGVRFIGSYTTTPVNYGQILGGASGVTIGAGSFLSALSTSTNGNVLVNTTTDVQGRFQVSQTSSTVNPHVNIISPTGANYGRFKYSNSGNASYFSNEAVSTDGDMGNSAWSVSHYNGAGKEWPVLLINGQRKVYINAFNIPVAAFHVMTNTATAQGIASEGFNQPGQIILARNNEPGGISARVAINNGEEIGRILFAGYNGTSYTGGYGTPNIKARASEAFTNAKMGTDLVFSTVRNGGIIEYEVMKLLNSGKVIIQDSLQLPFAGYGFGKFLTSDNFGNTFWSTPPAGAWISSLGSTTLTNISDKVGIGTSNPLSALHVETDGTLTNGFRVSNLNSTSNGPSIYLDAQNQDWTILATNGGHSSGANKFVIRDYTNAADRFVIDNTGKVGIGLDSPEGMLHVRNSAGSQIKFGNNNQPSYDWYFDVDGAANMYLKNESLGSSVMSFNPNNGFVGIGTNNPQAFLDVVGSGDVAAIGATSSGTVDAITAKNTNALTTSYAGNFDGGLTVKGKTTANADYALKVSSSSFEVFGIRNNGNIGINVLNPTYKLQINSSNTVAALYSENIVTGNFPNAHGVWGRVSASNTSTAAAAVYANSNGSGPSVYGVKNGSDANGSAGRFEILSTSNSADGVFVSNNGVGAAIHAVSGPTVAGSSNVALLLEGGHVKTVGGTPSVTTIIAGTASIVGNDIVGTYVITSSASTTADQNIVNVTFNKPYSTAPNVMLFGNNGATFNAKPYATSVTSTGFTITFNGSVAPGTYSIKYLVIQ